MKNLLSKGRILKDENMILYGMPSLERKDIQNIIGSGYLQEKIEAVEKDAYEKGFAVGERAGIEMGEQKAGLMLNRLENIISEIEEVRKNIVKETEPQVIDLVMVIARKIMIEELSIRPESVVRIVKEAIRRLERTGPITIKVNPSLHELFVRMKPELTEIHPEIILDIDPSASTKGPLVIGPVEEVVTDIDEQIANIMEDIRGNLGSR